MDTNKQQQIEKLKLEYQYAFEGYKYRDTLIPSEFNQIIQTFLFFNTIMAAFTHFATQEHFNSFVALLILIGMTGGISIFALLLDIESNLSCKVVMRQRCEEIEKELETFGINPNYWETVKHREKYLFEKMIKGSPGVSELFKKHGDFIVIASRFLLTIWIVNWIIFFLVSLN